MTEETGKGLTHLPKGKYISLKTYRRNGDGISSPVWFVEENLKFYACTGENTFKARRIKNNSQVQIASSNSSGKTNSEYFDAEAQFLTTDKIESIRRLFRNKYRMFRFWSFFQNLRKKEGEKQIYLEISPK